MWVNNAGTLEKNRALKELNLLVVVVVVKLSRIFFF